MPEKRTSDERFREVWRQLNHNQRRFVVQLADSDSKKDAAIAIGIGPHTVYGWPNIVDEACDLYSEHVRDAAAEVLAAAVAKAALIKVCGMDSTDEKIRQASATEILDRLLGKANQPLTTDGEIEINIQGFEDMLERVYGSDR